LVLFRFEIGSATETGRSQAKTRLGGVERRKEEVNIAIAVLMAELSLLAAGGEVTVLELPGSCVCVEREHKVSRLKEGGSSACCFLIGGPWNGGFVYVRDEDGALIAHKSAKHEGQVIHMQVDQVGPTVAVVHRENTEEIYTGCGDGRIRSYKLTQNSSKAESMPISTVAVTCMDIKGDVLAVGTALGKIYVINLLTQGKFHISPPSSKDSPNEDSPRVQSLSLSSLDNDHALGAAYDNGDVAFFSTLDGSRVRYLPKLHVGGALALVFTQNKHIVLSCGLDKKLYKVDKSKQGESPLLLKILEHTPSCAALTPARDAVGFGFSNGNIDILGMDDGLKRRNRFNLGKNEPVNALKFRMNGKRRILASRDYRKIQVASRNAENEKLPGKKGFSSENIEEDLAAKELVNTHSKLYNEKRIEKSTSNKSKAEDLFTTTKKPHRSRRPVPSQNQKETRTERKDEEESIERELRKVGEKGSASNASVPQFQVETAIETERKAPRELENFQQETPSPPVQQLERRLPRKEEFQFDIVDDGGLKRTVGEWMEDLDSKLVSLRLEVKSDVRSLQTEMMRQFKLQMDDIRECFDDFAERVESLIDENEKLRKDNEKLQRLY